jgi:serine/threonine protein kinase
MEEIHKHDILHRDLKPENIFIDGKADKVSAKIGDFGLARLLKPQTSSVNDNLSEPYSTPDRRMESNNSPTMEMRSRNMSYNRFNQYFSSTAGTEVYMAPEIK